MAKRGRKPSTEKKGYFYDIQEEAVIEYLNEEDPKRKNEIYNTILRPAFEKMIESIIRRYKLFIPNEDFNDTFNDTLSFLMTKADKFEIGKYKAYSYYGTICKNYLIGRIQNYNKTLQRNPSYDNLYDEFGNNAKYSNAENRNAEVASETVSRLTKRIGDMIEHPEENGLKESEIKVGKALKNLFENWDYVLTTDGSNKLNKNAILLFLRENTGMDAKGIRDNMKKYKKEFLIIKDFVIS